MKNPVNYISTSNGMFRVIVNGCPVCADKKTLSEALAVVAQMKITLCGDTMFNGDIGEFTPVNPVAPVAIVAPVVDITIKRVINAQTIINEVMQAHAIAPDEQGEYRNDFACFWPRFVPYGFEDLNESTSEYPTSAEDAHRELIYALMTEAASEVNELYMVPGKIKFQTAQKGFHTIQNTKKNLQRFADMVRKNHVAFGGGLIRAVKAKPSVSWDAKLISVFKQSIECSDFQAAFDVGAKLGALFFKSRKGEAFMQVAPVPFELDQRLVSVLNQDGKYSVIEPVSMCSVDGSSYVQKRSRAGQVENVAFRFKTFSSDSVENMFLKAHQSTADQDALRAQWLTEHGLTSEAVETRIETHEIEISEAIDAPEIVETVSLGDRFEAELAKRKATREAQAAQDVAQVVANAVAAVAISEAMQPSETREVETCQAGDGEANVSSYGSTTNTKTWAPVPEYVPCSPLKTGLGDGPKPAFSGNFDGGNEGFSGDSPVAPTPTVAVTGGTPTPRVVETVTIQHGEVVLAKATKYGLNAYTFSNRTQAQNAADKHGGEVIQRGRPFFVRMPAAKTEAQQVQDMPAVNLQEAPEVTHSHESAPKGQQVISKSGKWSAYLFKMIDGTQWMTFEATSGAYDSRGYDTASDRMKALQTMARAADAPTDTPPNGGLPCPATPPVAQSAPCTPATVSSEPRYPRNVIPADGLHIVDDAFEAWTFTSGDRFAFVMYLGKSAKPWKYFGYPTEAKRDAGFERYVAEAREIAAGIAKRKIESKAQADKPHGLIVGDVVRSSWGYDQTNINHYQIVNVIGKRTVEVRELAEHEEATGDMTGRVAPVHGDFVGDTKRCTVDKWGQVNVRGADYGRASKIEPIATVHGVRCYAASQYSSYA